MTQRPPLTPLSEVPDLKANTSPVPPMDGETAERINEIIARHIGREGPLLPILHDVQAEFGMIPEAAQPVIGAALGLSRAEVYGVVSFYHDFREAPAGRHILRLCRAEACQSMGADALHARIQAALGLDWHETTPDGRLTLEPVFCLGLCACAPSAQMDDKLVGRVTVDKAVKLAGEAA